MSVPYWPNQPPGMETISSFTNLYADTISTGLLTLDGAALTANGTELFLNGIPIATTANISSLSDWSLDPAISTVAMAGNNIGSFGTAFGSTISTTTGKISSLVVNKVAGTSGVFDSVVVNTLNGAPYSSGSNWSQYPANSTVAMAGNNINGLNYLTANTVSSVNLFGNNTVLSSLIVNGTGICLSNNGSFSNVGVFYSAGTYNGYSVNGSNYFGNPTTIGNEDLYNANLIVNGAATLDGGTIHGITIGCLPVLGFNTVRIDVLPAGIDMTSATYITMNAGGAANLAAGGALSLAGGDYVEINTGETQFINTTSGESIVSMNRLQGNSHNGGSGRLYLTDVSSINGVPISSYQNISSISSLNEWALYPALSSISFSTGVDAVINSASVLNPITLDTVLGVVSGNLQLGGGLGGDVRLQAALPGKLSVENSGGAAVRVESAGLNINGLSGYTTLDYLSSVNQFVYTSTTGLGAVKYYIPSLTDISNSVVTDFLYGSNISTSVISGANDNLFGLGIPGLEIDAANVYISSAQTNVSGLLNCSTVGAKRFQGGEISVSSISTLDLFANRIGTSSITGGEASLLTIGGPLIYLSTAATGLVYTDGEMDALRFESGEVYTSSILTSSITCSTVNAAGVVTAAGLFGAGGGLQISTAGSIDLVAANQIAFFNPGGVYLQYPGRDGITYASTLSTNSLIANTVETSSINTVNVPLIQLGRSTFQTIGYIIEVPRFYTDTNWNVMITPAANTVQVPHASTASISSFLVHAGGGLSAGVEFQYTTIGFL